MGVLVSAAPRRRYFFQNALEELDAPGEWYLDRTAATLYFWPPAPIDSAPVYAPAMRTILEFTPGAADITVRGFTIEGCEGTSAAAQIERAFHLALGRPASEHERARSLAFLAAQSARSGTAGTALTDFCHTLFTLNEFIHVD